MKNSYFFLAVVFIIFKLPVCVIASESNTYISIPDYPSVPLLEEIGASSQEAKIEKIVRCVDQVSGILYFTGEDQNCQLIDDKTEELLPNNEITMTEGEHLLIACPCSDDDYYFNLFSKDPHNYTGYTGVYSFERNQKTKTSPSKLLALRTRLPFIHPLYWYVSKSGPYFLFRACAPGTTSFDIYSIKGYYYLLCHVTVHILEKK